jgi:NADH-quinone oxidoreductase subunit L
LGDEQDIYKMGGLRKHMPITFATYAIGMMALSGVPLLFSGFWSKDEILRAAWMWDHSKGPFALGLLGALLTAFYMTRQVLYIFFGSPRVQKESHESPAIMTVPLLILAGMAVCIGFLGTPAWPWIQSYLTAEPLRFELSNILNVHFLLFAAVSTIVVSLGVGLGWRFYKPRARLKELDPVEARLPVIFRGLRERLYIDEAYELSIIRFTRWLAGTAAWLELEFFAKVGWIATHFSLAGGWVGRVVDHFIINLGFERSCGAMRKSALEAGSWQNGKAQDYLRVIAITAIILFLLLAWGRKGA